MRLLNRDLSWLDFNARVLALAEVEHTPMLERAKFCAIVATNLDEFFMVRVAELQRQVNAGVIPAYPDDRSAGRVLDEVLERSSDLAARHARLWSRTIAPALADAGMRIARWAQLSDAQRAGLAGMFSGRVLEILRPLVVEPAHTLPLISDRGLNLAVALRDPVDASVRFAWVGVPPLLPRFVGVPEEASDHATFLPIEELIAGNLEQLFGGMAATPGHTFRLTREADRAVDDDAEELPSRIAEEMRQRRVAPAVRLEVARDMPRAIVDLLIRETGSPAGAVHHLPEPLGLGDLWELHAMGRPDLKDPPFRSRPSPALDRGPGEDRGPGGKASVIERLRGGDVLVHHPYESFAGSVQAFIEQAADDPQVVAIKQTLYRTTADPIVNALIRAAQAGKQVVVLVELRARFDEENNLAWARMLERAGCHVVYGMAGIKTHAKLALVVRREGAAARCYVHIGTGNYNAVTTRTYEDLGILSADPQLAQAVGELFDLLTGLAPHLGAERLMVAPFDLRPRLLARIAAEADAAGAGADARITIKCNALTDPEVIEALYAASRAGVRIDLIVRGICALRPQVPGMSDTIRVRSILGRFLEHSRIFRFGVGSGAERWIGSADLMERNLDRRVEVVVRLDDPAHQARVDHILDLALADTASAWVLDPDGTWAPPPDPVATRSVQARLLAEVEARHVVAGRYQSGPVLRMASAARTR